MRLRDAHNWNYKRVGTNYSTDPECSTKIRFGSSSIKKNGPVTILQTIKKRDRAAVRSLEEFRSFDPLVSCGRSGFFCLFSWYSGARLLHSVLLMLLLIVVVDLDRISYRRYFVSILIPIIVTRQEALCVLL